MDESGYVLHDQINSHGSAVVNIENVLGTTAGTSVLKDFTAGEFAIARNSGGTVTDTLTKGTANNFVLGTPAVTGGTIASPVFSGTATGTYTLAGTPTITSPTINTPTLTLANATTMTTDGGILYDRTNEKLLVGDGTNTQAVQTGAWTAYTPTTANITKGSGTLTGAYAVIGKTVFFKIVFVLAADSAVGTGPTFSLPLTGTVVASVLMFSNIYVQLLDATVAVFQGSVRAASNSSISILGVKTDATYSQDILVTASVPFTWTTSDAIMIHGNYEAT
jgi:hypothetical protein